LGPDVSFRGEAEVGRTTETAASVENDPKRASVSRCNKTAGRTSSAMAGSVLEICAPSAFAVFWIDDEFGFCGLPDWNIDRPFAFQDIARKP
jgi:hypothetical protein